MSQSHDLFSDAWAREWCRILDESDAYREAGAGWTGPIALVLDADPERGVAEPRAVRVELADGGCRGGGAVDAADAGAAPTVIGGSAETWRRVLTGELDPLFALMGGKLQVRSGSLSTLMPHARGAKELVNTARRVPTAFPDGWGRT